MTLEGHAAASSTRPASPPSTSATRSRPPTSTPSCSAARHQVAGAAASTRAAQQTATAAARPVRLRQLHRRRSTPIVAGLQPELRRRGLRPHAPVVHLRAAQLGRAARRGHQRRAATAGWSPTSTITLDKRTRKFVSVVGAERDRGERRPQPDGTWQTSAPGVFVRDPALVDPAAKTIADKYRTAVAPIANRVVGIDHRRHHPDPDGRTGESPLGDVIADAQLAYTQSRRRPDRADEPGRHPGLADRSQLARRRGAGPGHLRRGVHGAAVQQPGGHPDPHRRTAQGGAGAAVRRRQTPPRPRTGSCRSRPASPTRTTRPGRPATGSRTCS